MKKNLAFTLGALLAAGGMAVAQQPQETSDYDDASDQVSQYGDEASDPMSQSDPMEQTDPMEQADPMDQTDPMTDPMEDSNPMEQTYPTDESAQTMSQSDTDMDQSQDVSDWAAADLKGKTVFTSSGEEIGEIEMVGSQSGERIAVVDVGGYLMIADKSVAIPLTDLTVGADESVQTAMTKDSLENSEEFNEDGFTEEDAESDDTTDY